MRVFAFQRICMSASIISFKQQPSISLDLLQIHSCYLHRDLYDFQTFQKEFVKCKKITNKDVWIKQLSMVLALSPLCSAFQIPHCSIQRATAIQSIYPTVNQYIFLSVQNPNYLQSIRQIQQYWLGNRKGEPLKRHYCQISEEKDWKTNEFIHIPPTNRLALYSSSLSHPLSHLLNFFLFCSLLCFFLMYHYVFSVVSQLLQVISLCFNIIIDFSHNLLVERENREL